MMDTHPDPHRSAIQDLIQELYEAHRDLGEGVVADYIPELAKACPDDLGIAVATASGRLYEVGDTRKEFTIQSISKPFIYGLALKLLSPELMLSKIDVEPSGEAFNAISLDPQTGKPRNPMINAGAIAASAQLCAGDPDGAEGLMLNYFSELAARTLHIDHAVYRSEAETGHRNRAIGHLLRNFDIIETDPEPALDLYFRQCAIAVNCRDLAVMASTLACQGRNPFTGGRPLSAEITVRMLALMGTCGMYDFAGQWLHDVGIPAKSGVAGGVMAVIPGRLGIATYSPPLDQFGNSVRGVALCRDLSSRVGLSLFNQYNRVNGTIRRSYNGSQGASRRWRSQMERDVIAPHLHEIKIIHAQGVLDFSGVEQLCSELVSIGPKVTILILDLGHVTECPVESHDLLERQLAVLKRSGLEILLSRTDQVPGMKARGWSIKLSDLRHLDDALEVAEEMLLIRHRDDAASDAVAGFGDLGVTGLLSRLEHHHRAVVTGLMTLRRFSGGDQVIRAGQPGDELFLVQSGAFDIALETRKGDGSLTSSRLATFGPGQCFGEISFIAGGPRGADIIATMAGSCWVLHRRDFDQLSQSHPDVVIELLKALTCDLGEKLTRTNQQLTQMDHH